MGAKADKSMEQVARRHHYVSGGYLAAFTNTGTSKGVLCAYDHSTGTFCTPKPKHVAFEVDYNRVNAPTLRPDALETSLGHFESRAIRELRKIIATGKLPPPNDEDFSWFYNLIALFAVKCPALRRASDAARQQIIRELMDLT